MIDSAMVLLLLSITVTSCSRPEESKEPVNFMIIYVMNTLDLQRPFSNVLSGWDTAGSLLLTIPVMTGRFGVLSLRRAFAAINYQYKKYENIWT